MIDRLVGPWRIALLALALASSACVRDGDAQVPSAAASRSVDDTASLDRLLRAVRGADPLLCELATRSVDNHGWWSRWGPMSGNPLDGDSTAAAIISWIQRDHHDPRFVARLSAGMRDTDRCVRRVAGSFLGRVEHPAAVTALLAALDDQSADTRFVAVVGLGLSEDSTALQPLIRRLRDQSPDVRRAAAWSLGSLENKGALLPLIEVLDRDADARVRQAAAWAIGRVTG